MLNPIEWLFYQMTKNSTLFGGGFMDFDINPIKAFNSEEDFKDTYETYLPKDKKILSYDYLYEKCVHMKTSEIERNLVCVNQAIKYFEEKHGDLSLTWKITAAFLGILIPISAFVGFPSVADMINISKNKLKLIFCIIVLALYIFYFILFVSFMNTYNIKFHNYNLYSNILTKIKEDRQKQEDEIKQVLIDVIYNPEKYNFPFDYSNGKIITSQLIDFTKGLGYNFDNRLVSEMITNNKELSFDLNFAVIKLPQFLVEKYIQKINKME